MHRLHAGGASRRGLFDSHVDDAHRNGELVHHASSLPARQRGDRGLPQAQAAVVGWDLTDSSRRADLRLASARLASRNSRLFWNTPPDSTTVSSPCDAHSTALQPHQPVRNAA